MSQPAFEFHLIPNSHLDPVWLWDWREGLEEGVATCRSVLDLMDEEPEVTFIRGEALVYDYIARTDPANMKRIRRRIREGRWEPVGGTWLQADTNLPSLETFARQYHEGQRVFTKLLGRPARTAWAADSFGHAAGLPEVMVKAGIDSFAFTRPGDELPIAKAAFWWEAPSGARVLTYRPYSGYCGNRFGLPETIDRVLERTAKAGMRTAGVFLGLGNHGGGMSRRQLDEVRAWAAKHPEVRMVFSGLERLFDAIRAEARTHRDGWLPVHRGELNFCFRGCYASMAKLKFPFRRIENAVVTAEAADALVAARLGRKPVGVPAGWDALLFNSFHDILPGSSIERAYDDQIAWLGTGRHHAALVQADALVALARRIDTRVPDPVAFDHPRAVPVLIWNPLPRPVETLVEIEVCLDSRPLEAYNGRAEAVPIRLRDAAGADLPFQRIETEHRCFPQWPWRARIVAPLTLPALGWHVVDMGYIEGSAPPPVPADRVTAAEGAISNGIFRIEAAPGGAGVRILRHGKPFLVGDGLGARLEDDPFGSWGVMGDDSQAHVSRALREAWTVTATSVREHGPHRAALWVRLAGARSRIDLTFRLAIGRDAVDIEARVFIDDRSVRLHLVMPTAATEAEYAVPGGSQRRGPIGAVPAGRWVRCGGVGFASDALSSFATTTASELLATVCRASRYADDRMLEADAEPWRPAADSGELRFRCLLAPSSGPLEDLAEALERPPVTLPVPVATGDLPRSASLLALAPASVRLQALKPAADGKGLILRVHNEGAAVVPRLAWLGRSVRLTRVGAGAIASWRLRPGKRGWTAAVTDLREGQTTP